MSKNGQGLSVFTVLAIISAYLIAIIALIAPLYFRVGTMQGTQFTKEDAQKLSSEIKKNVSDIVAANLWVETLDLSPEEKKRGSGLTPIE